MFTMRDGENFGSGLDITLLERCNADLKLSASFDAMDYFHRTLEDRNAEPSLSFDHELRDGPPQTFPNHFHQEEKRQVATEVPMEVSTGDIGSMTFCPVDGGRADEMFGSDEPFFGLNDPNERVSRFDGLQQPEVATTRNVDISNHDNATRTRYETETTTPPYDAFLAFHDMNETNFELETVQHFQDPDVAASVAVQAATPDSVTTTATTRTVSPSLNNIGEDYRAEWAKPRGSGEFDYFAEVVRKPQGVQAVSVPNLSLLDQHVIVKTQLGLAVLLKSETTTTTGANNPTVALPTANALRVRQSSDASSNRKFQRWSPEEDDVLKQAVDIEGGKTINWKRIASKYFGNARTALQCKSRWTKSLKPGINRGAWTPEEDARVIRYRQEGKKWSDIAKFMPGRLAEHIADRFCNVLDPTLKKCAWTPEEDKILFREQRRLGNKWTQISQLIPGRSENSVKNRWHNLKVTRERRMRSEAMNRQREEALQAVDEEEEDEPLPFATLSNDNICTSSRTFAV